MLYSKESILHIVVQFLHRTGRFMTLEQFEYIIAVYREGTISAAAQKLNISHPSISRAISSLETELGVNVFLRSRSGSELTEKGKLVLKCAQNILHEVELLRSLSGGAREPRILQVKAFPIDSMLFFSDVLSALKARHSHMTVNIAHANVSEIINDLKAQKVDFGILALPCTEREMLGPEIKSKLLFESQFMIACSGRSALASREILSASDIKGMPFIFHPDSLILRNVQQMFADVGFPAVLTYSNENSLIKQIVSRGEALSIYTEQLGKSDPRVVNGELVLRPFECKNGLNRVDYLCIYNAKKQLLPEESDFVDILLKTTSSLRTSH